MGERPILWGKNTKIEVEQGLALVIIGKKLEQQPSYTDKTLKNLLIMGSFVQFRGQVLPCPMLIMLPISPQAASTHIINQPFVSYINSRFILSIVQSQLPSCKFLFFQAVFFEKIKAKDRVL